MKSLCPETEHYSLLANILGAEDKPLLVLLVLRFASDLAQVPCGNSLISSVLLHSQNQVKSNNMVQLANRIFFSNTFLNDFHYYY